MALWVGLALVALIAVLQLANTAVGERTLEAKPATPTPSATPTTAPHVTASSDRGCPAGLHLPEGVSPEVCTPVDPAALTTLEPSKRDGASIMIFRSPSGSIACADVRGRTVACAVKGRTFDVPHATEGETIVLSAGRPLPSSDIQAPAAAVDEPANPPVPQLRFGQIVRMNADWFCGVQEVGVSCWSAKARSGLLVSRTQWVTWSPGGIERAS